MFTMNLWDKPRDQFWMRKLRLRAVRCCPWSHSGRLLVPVWCPCYCLPQGASEGSGQQTGPWDPGAGCPLRAWLLELPGRTSPWSGVLVLLRLWWIPITHINICLSCLSGLMRGPGPGEEAWLFSGSSRDSGTPEKPDCPLWHSAPTSLAACSSLWAPFGTQTLLFWQLLCPP